LGARIKSVCSAAALAVALAMMTQVAALGQGRPDIVIADFEGPDYGAWTVTGTAFGPGPAQGTLPGQMPVNGYRGHGLVNSYYGGDASTGTLASPPFRIERRYVNFLIGGGMHPGETCMNLLVDGKVARTATGPNDKPGGSEALTWKTWDVIGLEGKTATIEIVDRATGGWGHINVDDITESDEKAEQPIRTDVLYDETYRPQFHFTPQKNWTNDPNGLVYYKGEYHLFFQHNPFGIDWGNMTWGHAVSRDLVHWKQLPNAIEPDSRGTIFSGSAAVDWTDSSGLKTGKEALLVALYTAAGDTSPESRGQPFTQCLAFSNDRGRTWLKYSGNPVLGHIVGGNRDPKLVWYAPLSRWVLALYLDREDYALFTSPDLKRWEKLQTIPMPGCGECPDFFEIPIAGEPGAHKWVFTSASGKYLVGDFDGRRFTQQAGPLQVDFGANYYAVQTYSDIPKSDGRRIQIAWMNGGGYPQMPFNQQMSFPCTLTLRRTPEGLRLFRWPVKEIEKLRIAEERNARVALQPDVPVLSGLSGELLDVEAELEIGTATSVGLTLRGESVVYDPRAATLTCLGRSAPLQAEHGRVRIRALVDRTSLEVFGNGGRVSLTSCFLPLQKDRAVAAFAHGGTAKLISIRVRTLRSSWR
jgi:sucrose-6-phosphate hydrolase SacC (GH32 family)